MKTKKGTHNFAFVDDEGNVTRPQIHTKDEESQRITRQNHKQNPGNTTSDQNKITVDASTTNTVTLDVSTLDTSITVQSVMNSPDVDPSNNKHSINDGDKCSHSDQNVCASIEKAPVDKERQMWDRPLECILSCIAMSVGLGNVWRFPTVAYENGGGAFLIPYMVVLLFIGRPMYFLELGMGQFTSSSAVKVWKMVPAVKGLGYAQAIATWSVVTYYCSIIAISFFYLSQSFQSVLPWSVCDPSWADNETCVEIGDYTENTTDGGKKEMSAEQYFKRFLLHQPKDLSEGPGMPDWRLTLCLLITWLIILMALVKGVKSSGKVSYLTALFPYVGLITLLVKGCTLPGAMDGILFFITPQWDKLLTVKVWYAAVTQCFFSLSVAFGAIVMFSSHNQFRQNIYRDALIISLMDTFTSLLSGFTIFSVLGYLKHMTHAEHFDDIVAGGTTLAFVSYPTALASFETLPQVFAVLFFLVLIILGVGSSAALSSMIIAVIADKFPKVKQLYITAAFCTAGFLFGLVYVTPGGQWVLDLVDFFGGGFIIFVIAVVQVASVFWIYGLNNYLRDMRFMLGMRLGFYWKFCWAFFMPVGLSGIFVFLMASFELPTYNNGMAYPTIAYVFGWLLTAAALIMFPICALHAYTQARGTPMQRLQEIFKPSAAFGPRLTQDRESWQHFCSGGEQRMDRWKALAKEAIQDPNKVKEFDDLYHYVHDRCQHWDVMKEKKGKHND